MDQYETLADETLKKEFLSEKGPGEIAELVGYSALATGAIYALSHGLGWILGLPTWQRHGLAFALTGLVAVTVWDERDRDWRSQLVECGRVERHEIKYHQYDSAW